MPPILLSAPLYHTELYHINASHPVGRSVRRRCLFLFYYLRLFQLHSSFELIVFSLPLRYMYGEASEREVGMSRHGATLRGQRVWTALLSGWKKGVYGFSSLTSRGRMACNKQFLRIYSGH